MTTYAFQILSTSTTRNLRTMRVRVVGHEVELTSFRGGNVEVYVVKDGLAEFHGYIETLRLSESLCIALWQAWSEGLRAAA